MKLAGFLLCALLFGCASLARSHCEELFCAHADPVESCEHINDLVPLCAEERVQYYGSVAGWFGGALVDLMGLAKGVAL